MRAALSDPEALARALGLCEGPPRRDRGEWWREGSGVMVRCPLHDGVSLHVRAYQDGVGWQCYGCAATGDVFGLVSAVHGTSKFIDTLRIAATLAGVDIGAQGPRQPALAATSRPIAPPQRCDDRLDAGAFDALAQALLNDPLTDLDSDDNVDVREYLDSRCILHAALVDGWRALPPSDGGQAVTGRVCPQRALVQRLRATVGAMTWERSGLARRDAPERFTFTENRLLIPWRDRLGRVTGLQRRLPRGERAGEHRYVQAGKVRDPYGAEHLSAHPAWSVVFVEGAVDVLSLRCLLSDTQVEGYDPRWFVLGLPGAGAWRSEWAELARDRAALIGLDLDSKQSAQKATERAGDRMRLDLEGVARSVHISVPNDGKDWNEALSRHR